MNFSSDNLDLHLSSSLGYNRDETYYFTNTKMLITERTDGVDLFMIKLVYSISFIRNSFIYTITLGDLNRTLSFFYFNQSQVDQYNRINGCSISHKEYNFEYIHNTYICFCIERLKNYVIKLKEIL